MISRILDVSVRQRWLVLLLSLLAAGFGGYALTRLPIDAVPDITTRCRSTRSRPRSRPSTSSGR